MNRPSFDLSPGCLGPLTIGATRADVHAALGRPASANDRTARWMENALRVDFDAEGCVELVEIHRGAPLVRICARDPFELDEIELEDFLVPVFGPRVAIENGATWVLPGSQLAVHRQSLPQAFAIARPGYHDDSVRGDVRVRTVLVVGCDADEDDIAAEQALLECVCVLETRAEAVIANLVVIATFAGVRRAFEAVAEVDARFDLPFA